MLKKLIIILLLGLMFSLKVQAKVVEYTLTVSQGSIKVGETDFNNKFLVNGSIPGPELTFQLGDTAKIRVINKTSDKTLMHWHGILLPNDQDGVPLVNSLPIESGGEKIYEFPIKQTGTYWYHSHVMFQEEDGVYGPIRILPKQNSQITESTILLADLTKESGEEVHRNLKRDGEYYDIFKGTVQSWLKAFQTGTALTKWRNSLQRMGGMDYADVAYDYFTANGQPITYLFQGSQSSTKVKLRIINGSTSSIFKITYAGGPITIVEADGLPVEPVRVNILPISVAETYDVLVDLQPNKQLELRATSLDNSGYSSTFLGPMNGEKIKAPDMPWEQPIGVTMGEMMGMPEMGFWQEFAMVYKNEFKDIPKDISYELKDQYMLPSQDVLMPMMDHSKMSSGQHGHSHGQMNHQMMKDDNSFRIMNQAPETMKNNLISSDGISHYNELTYGLLKAKEPIDDNSNQKLRVIPFTLNGNMENYVWTINGRPLGPETYIKIKKGERVRFVMKNTTMMNHPMHLHGHFFRVMTNQGKWSVLKHTVNVAPLSTTVIEFAANDEKDWFFDCHILYHMMDGMTRIVRYEDKPGSEQFSKMRSNSREFNSTSDFFFRNKLLGQSNYSRLEGRFFSSYYQFEYDFIGNYEGNYEGEVHIARTLTRFLSLYVGGRVEQEGHLASESSPTVGFTWLLPLNIEVDVKYQPLFDDNLIEIEFENMIQLTDKLQMNLEYSSIRNFYTELEWRQTKHLSFTANYNRTFDTFGFGLGYTY